MKPGNVNHATCDLNGDLITSFQKSRLDQHQLILNATSGSWESSILYPLFFWDKQNQNWEIWTPSINLCKINSGAYNLKFFAFWLLLVCILVAIEYKPDCLFKAHFCRFFFAQVCSYIQLLKHLSNVHWHLFVCSVLNMGAF